MLHFWSAAANMARRTLRAVLRLSDAATPLRDGRPLPIPATAKARAVHPAGRVR